MAARQGQDSALLAVAKWTAVDSLKVRYVEGGRRSGPDILLLAPILGGLPAFDALWPSIVATGRVVAVDLGGLEGCARLSSPRAVAAFVIKAIDVFRLRHPHLLAADMLGASAFFTALAYPGAVESLILIERVLAVHCPPTQETQSTAFEKLHAEAWPELAAKFHQITTPALVVAAPQSASMSARGELLKAMLPRCRLVVVSGEPEREASSICAKLVDAWVSGEYRSMGSGRFGTNTGL